VFKAVLVDDEILVLNLLDKIISDRPDIKIMDKYTDPEKALLEIPKLKPDVVFLDIDMPELDGIQLGTKLLETVDNIDMEIVFVTAFEQYAVHAFKLNAIHYILKPVDANSVDEVMERIYKKKKVVQAKLNQRAEIKVFGHMQLLSNKEDIDFLTPKIEELLALLVINREKGISKWRLIDVLWEETSMDKSKQNLHTMIFRLKKKLRDAGINVDIKYKNSIYTVDLKDVHCDLKEFDQLIKENPNVNEENIDKFEKVIYLYTGDLLVEKDYSWCVFDREKYYQCFLNLVMEVKKYYTKKNQKNSLEKLYYHIRPILIKDDYNLILMPFQT